MKQITDAVGRMNDEMWVLLWSRNQNAFHVETLAAMLKKNRAAYADNRPGDYRVLHIGYREEVDGLADACRGTLKHRPSTLEDVLRKAI